MISLGLSIWRAALSGVTAPPTSDLLLWDDSTAVLWDDGTKILFE